MCVCVWGGGGGVPMWSSMVLFGALVLCTVTVFLMMLLIKMNLIIAVPFC